LEESLRKDPNIANKPTPSPKIENILPILKGLPFKKWKRIKEVKNLPPGKIIKV